MSLAQPPVTPPAQDREPHLQVVWTTISYRAIAFYCLLALTCVAFIVYLISPNAFSTAAHKLLAFVTAGAVQTQEVNLAAFKKEAHFVNLDGTVQVRKSQSPQWIHADFNTPLEKGDFVQTGSDGLAQINFSDGTNYVLKPDSLIVIEESGEDPVTKASRVAVQVTSGAVDLSTGRFEVPGSTSQVAMEDAVANLGQEARAVVRNDPSHDIHQLTVDQGQAQVTRGSTTVQLGQYDQVSFNAGQPGLKRSKIIAPPNLDTPLNMALTITKNPRTTPITFSWSAVPGAEAYRLQVSPSGMFSNLVVDKTLRGRTSTEVSGLDEGVYYWVVSSIDQHGVESQPSAPNRFNLVQQAEEGNKAYLKITSITQHGRVVEVVGRTEPGSTVIINNEQVFNIGSDGMFRHFTAPLTKKGSNEITITAQDRKGNTNTIRKAVVIE